MSKRSYNDSSCCNLLHDEEGQQQQQQQLTKKRNRKHNPTTENSRQVFAKVPSEAINGHTVVDFLSQMMTKEGMIENQEDGILRFQFHGRCRQSYDCWCLELSTEVLADQLCYLNGISLNEEMKVFIKLQRRSNYSVNKPRFKSWNQYHWFRYHRNTLEAECCVYAYTSEKMDASRLRGLLNDEMKDHFYSIVSQQNDDGPIILSCQEICDNVFMLSLRTPELAEKLLWLHGMHIGNLKLKLRRANEYRGPSPKYSSVDDLIESDEYQTEIKIYVDQNPSKNTGGELLEFLSERLSQYRLSSSTQRLVEVYDVSKTDIPSWMIIASNPKIASRVMYLDQITWNDTALRIRRDRDYIGPPPHYQNFSDFERAFQGSQAAARSVSFLEKRKNSQTFDDTTTTTRASFTSNVRDQPLVPPEPLALSVVRSTITQSLELPHQTTVTHEKGQDEMSPSYEEEVVSNADETGSVDQTDQGGSEKNTVNEKDQVSQYESTSEPNSCTNGDEVIELRRLGEDVTRKFETTLNRLAEVTSQLATTKIQMKDVTSQFETKQEQLAEVSGELVSTKTRLNDVTSLFKIKQKQLAEVTGELALTKSHLEHVTSKFETKQKQLDDATGELTTTKTCLKDVTSQLAMKQKQLSDVTCVLAKTESHLKDSNSKFAMTQKQLDRVTGELAKTKKERDEAHSRLKDASSMFETTQNKLISVKRDLITTKKQRDDVGSRLKDANARVGTMEKLLTKANADVVTANKQRDEFCSQIRNVNSQVATMQQQLNETIVEAETAKKIRDEINADWGHQKMELDDKKQEIDELKRQLEDAGVDMLGRKLQQTERNLRNAVESLTVQGDELIQERNAKRKLEDALHAFRQASLLSTVQQAVKGNDASSD